jgi:uncharacterized protein YidB (DUF937 family)
MRHIRSFLEMANKAPSMVALLGLLAVAGYQNRDKLSEVFNKVAQPGPNGQQQPGLDGLLSGLGGLFGGGGTAPSSPGAPPAAPVDGNTINTGLGDLLKQFQQAGKGDVADSWVSTGPNKGLAPDEVEQAVGADNIAELSERTGLSREELLQRLSTTIPHAVDKLTPEGRLPGSDGIPGLA